MEAFPSPVPPASQGKIAFQQGVIFGLAQALVGAIILYLNNFLVTNTGLSLLLSVLSFLLSLAAYFVAGIMAAKQTGRVRTGTFAGMWTALVYGLINIVISSLVFFLVGLPKALDVIASSSSYNPSQADTYHTVAIIGGEAVFVFGMLIGIGLGAGLGALGGLIGRKISPFKATAMPAYTTYQAPPYPAPLPPTPLQPYSYPAPPVPPSDPSQSVPPTPPEQINPEQ